LAPVYGILIADYYLARRQRLKIQQIYSADPDGNYFYRQGWNPRA
jgi:NCS1 family nucleobase:cation symporter-1